MYTVYTYRCMVLANPTYLGLARTDMYIYVRFWPSVYMVLANPKHYTSSIKRYPVYVLSRGRLANYLTRAHTHTHIHTHMHIYMHMHTHILSSRKEKPRRQ